MCPVCDSASREVFHEKLVDNVFRIASGQWSLYRCTQCLSGYLDPRPSEASISRAYATYYTHEAGVAQRHGSNLNLPRRLRRSIFNGYVNNRYGTQFLPASKSGTWVIALLLRYKQRLDAKFRYLPKPLPGQRLLDIGCGNGDFLLNAKAAGWQIQGIDTDPMAVEVAMRRELNASVGSIDSFDGMSNCFDAITLSHVIEHVHDPCQLIRAIQRLLKPGGVVYIDTPNIGSKGAKLWQENWRGLEAPRHLVLFSLGALVELLKANGFHRHEMKRRTAVRKFIYLCSLRMQKGESPQGRVPAKLPLITRLRLKYAITPVEEDEFITLLAWKDNA